MSYARFDRDSDIYLIGILKADNTHLIQCCGCILCERGPWPGPGPEPTVAGESGFKDWVLEPYPEFSDKDKLLQHIALHVSAGHQVPSDVHDLIENDDWIKTAQN